MKHLYQAFLLSFFIVTTTVFGQVVILDGVNMVSSPTLTIPFNNTNLEGSFTFKNCGNRSETYSIVRKQIVLGESNFTEQLCFGYRKGNCIDVYSNTEFYNFPMTLTLAPEEKGQVEFAINYQDLTSDTYLRYYIVNAKEEMLDSVDVRGVTSLSAKENTKPAAITVNSFPNPVSNVLSIVINGSTENHVKLVDILGKTIINEKIGATKKLDVSDLNNGVYVLTISTASGRVIQNKRVVIKH